MQRVEKSQKTVPEQIDHLKVQLSGPTRTLPDRIAMPYQNGVTFVNLKDVLYCESDDNYTRFYLVDGQHYLATKSLRDIQDLLEEGDFLRVHRQYLINLNQIKKFVKGEGNYLVMNNLKSIPVSRAQKDRLMERFGWL